MKQYLSVLLFFTVGTLYAQENESKGFFFKHSIGSGAVISSWDINSNSKGNYNESNMYPPISSEIELGYQFDQNWEVSLHGRGAVNTFFWNRAFDASSGIRIGYNISNRLAVNISSGICTWLDFYDVEKGIYGGLHTNYGFLGEKMRIFGIKGGIYFQQFMPNQDDQYHPNDYYFSSWTQRNFVVDLGVFWCWGKSK
jgi:hypothetical protein